MHVNARVKHVARGAALLGATLASAACAVILGVDDRTLDDGPDVTDGSFAEAAVDVASPPLPETGADAGAPDAPSDAATVDAVAACLGVPVATCAGCSTGSAACRGACVSDCTNGCDPATLGCFACPRGIPTGTCEPAFADASCIANPAYPHCPCLADAAACPGANQVCVANECRTCGEPGTVGEVCRDGTGQKKCKAATDPDPTKRLRCK